MRNNTFLMFIIVNLLVCIVCNGYSQWKYLGGPDTKLSDGLQPAITSLYVTNCEVFAGTECGIYKSTDGCKTWTRSPSIDSNLKVIEILRNGNTFFAGTDVGGIYSSDDDCVTWRKTGGFDSTLCMAVNDSFIIAGNTRGMQKCRIDDSVWTWVDADKVPFDVLSIAAKDSAVVIGGYNGVVYRSNDFGNTWNAVTHEGYPLSFVVSLVISGETIFASVPANGLYCIVNSGTSWTRINGLITTMLGDVAVIGSTILAATRDSIYCTDFFGRNWHSVSAGLENITVSTVFVSGSSLYIGTEHDGIWYRPVSEFIVSVFKPFDHQVVRKTDLKLQHSNNPGCHSVINFSIPESMPVKIILYDIAGHNVSTPVNGYYNKGMYSVPLSDKIAQGFYIARMNAGGSVMTARQIIR